MRIKNPRLFITTFIAFAIISTLRSCSSYHLNKESKEGRILRQKIEELQSPQEKDTIDVKEIELEEPTIHFYK